MVSDRAFSIRATGSEKAMEHLKFVSDSALRSPASPADLNLACHLPPLTRGWGLAIAVRLDNRVQVAGVVR
jgi:hypothetical protein